jgi:hypothetical protein
MRTLIVSTLMTLGLTGGVAAADNYRGEAHHEVDRGHYRDSRVRPTPRFERHDERRGYRWTGGEWRWNRSEWIWAPGRYVRITR